MLQPKLVVFEQVFEQHLFIFFFNFQTIGDKNLFVKGPEIHKLQSSYSPTINVELPVQFNQRLHGYNINCGEKGTPSAWEREGGREREGERQRERETDRERKTERLELIKVADKFVERTEEKKKQNLDFDFGTTPCKARPEGKDPVHPDPLLQ